MVLEFPSLHRPWVEGWSDRCHRVLQTTFFSINANPTPTRIPATAVLDALLLAPPGLSDAGLCATKICNWRRSLQSPPRSAIPTHIALLPLVPSDGAGNMPTCMQCWLLYMIRINAHSVCVCVVRLTLPRLPSFYVRRFPLVMTSLAPCSSS